MSILHSLGDVAIKWIDSFGYWGVFLGMVLESMCIPIPSEVIMPFSGYLVAQHHIGFLGAVIAGTIGNIVGSLIAYAVGYWGGKKLLARFQTNRHYQKAEQWFQKRGEATVFISRLLPAIRTFISLPAGIAKMNLGKFILYTAVGSIPWSLALTLVGYYLGTNWQRIESFLHPIAYLVVLVLVVLVVRAYLKIKKEKELKN